MVGADGGPFRPHRLGYAVRSLDLNVIAVGTRMPAWVGDGWNEYARRLPPHLKLKLLEVPASGKASGPENRLSEGRRLLSRCPNGGIAVALDAGGQAWSTRQLAERFEQWQDDGGPVSFLIGGAEGLSAPVLEQCHLRWSLGPLTLPHLLVRVIVAEQLYRAHTILAGHPYHRA